MQEDLLGDPYYHLESITDGFWVRSLDDDDSLLLLRITDHYRKAQKTSYPLRNGVRSVTKRIASLYTQQLGKIYDSSGRLSYICDAKDLWRFLAKFMQRRIDWTYPRHALPLFWRHYQFKGSQAVFDGHVASFQTI